MFAVEDTAAQVTWRSLPAGTVIEAGDAAAVVDEGGRPGAAVLHGLPPATRLSLTLVLPGAPRARVARFRTLPRPPGRLLSRFATLNDLHVGERRFGLLPRIGEGAPPRTVDTYALRCARAAVWEAAGWGAEALVVKGDLTYWGLPDEWDAVARLLRAPGLPVLAVLGNHDVGRRAVDGLAALAARGIDVPRTPYLLDLPGIRVVMAHTAVPRTGRGRLHEEERAAVATLVADAATPVFVGMHHYPQRFERPLSYPPGIPASEARPFLDALATANPATLVACGHSHRNRRRRHGPLVVVQVGATMHYPGVWAGYAVHEGGIRQVLRRVAAPDAIAWTERTRRALGGLWGPWAAGRRSHRCFVHEWPARR